MDTNQAAKMIEWLDEERRKDKATITTLQQQLKSQQELSENLQRRLHSLESDQSSIKSQVTSNIREAEIMENMRRELQQVVDQIETRRQKSEQEVEKRAEIGREALLRQVRELSDKFSRVERHTTELPAINVEKDRLAGTVSSVQQRVDDLSRRIEDPDRRIQYLEEQRRTDARRLSELESELPETRKQIDSLRPKLQLIEDLALRNERRISETQNSDRERRDQIQQFIDQQNLLFQQRDQQVQDLIKRFTEQETSMEKNLERLESWADTYREMRRVLDEFERISEHLQRKINEVSEVQRLSEERFRQEWSDWKEDDQKRWRTYTSSTDKVWTENDTKFEDLVAKVNRISELFGPLEDNINRIWSLERERAQLYRDHYQTMLLDFDPGTSSAPSISKTTGTMPAVTTTSITDPVNADDKNSSVEPSQRSSELPSVKSGL